MGEGGDHVSGCLQLFSLRKVFVALWGDFSALGKASSPQRRLFSSLRAQFSSHLLAQLADEMILVPREMFQVPKGMLPLPFRMISVPKGKFPVPNESILVPREMRESSFGASKFSYLIFDSWEIFSQSCFDLLGICCGFQAKRVWHSAG